MSGIIFAGCSFTHGHGLWFYNQELYGKYNREHVVNSICEERPNHHMRYKDVLRFPRLVSQELEMFEITRLSYSGNDEDSVDFINHVFDFKSPNSIWSTEHYKYDEVKYIIFQTSRPERCHYITPDGKIRLNGNENDVYEIFKKYNFIDYDDYETKLCQQLFDRIRKTFIFYENKGIIPLIFNWTNHYNLLIENDDYMNERKINIKFNDKEYKSLNDVIDVDDTLTIHKDYEFFGDSPPWDYHPSKRFHRIIADSIIEKIRLIGKSSLSIPPLN